MTSFSFHAGCGVVRKLTLEFFFSLCFSIVSKFLYNDFLKAN